MNKYYLRLKEIEKNYGINGTSRFAKRKWNVIQPLPQNSWKHECAKFYVAYLLRKAGKVFIAEALSKKTGEIHDIVCLDDDLPIEIETTEKRGKRFYGRRDVLLVPLWKMEKVREEIEKLMKQKGVI